MKGATKWVLGLAGLAATVYVVGWAWNKSQEESLNAAGGQKCRCKGTIMPCKFCAAGTPI